MFQEKRQNKRVKEDLNILCRIFQRIELDTSVSKIADISKSGASFLIDYAVNPGDILQIIFRIPPNFKEKVEVFGRVVACDPDRQQFKIRTAFIDIPAETKASLELLIQQANLKENQSDSAG